MDDRIKNLKSTTFGGKRFTRKQLEMVRELVEMFPDLSRRELGKTVCENLNWFTPKNDYKIQPCLKFLSELESLGIVSLPAKQDSMRRGRQKKVALTSRSEADAPISSSLGLIMPVRIELAATADAVGECNELLERYHYLGYSRPFGRSLRYLISDNQGRRLGCLLFEAATTQLPCRERWLGWDQKARRRRLELVVCNSRFLILPWVSVKYLASKSLSMATRRIAGDWHEAHGYRPVLVETFIDLTRFPGSSYRAANWQHIGMSDGRKATAKVVGKSQKGVFVYPLDANFKEILRFGSKAAVKPRRETPKPPPKLAAADPFVQLWQRIVMTLQRVTAEHDLVWQRRKRVLNTLLIVLFVFRLVQSTNRQGYEITLNELWENCRALKVELPREKPVSAAAMCKARDKVKADLFKKLHYEILKHVDDSEFRKLWKGHRVFAIDGTKLNLPRALMRSGYPLPTKSSHYPQGLLSTLYRLKSKIPADFELFAHANERTAAATHLDRLRENDVVVYDRGYFSYALLLDHVTRGIHPLFRVKGRANAEFAAFEEDGRTDAIVPVRVPRDAARKLRPKYPGREKFEPVSVRVVKYTVKSTDYLLVTTLTDRKAYSIKELSDLYQLRWGIEEMYKNSKTLVLLEDFHSKNENGIKQEIYAHFTYNMLVRQFTNHCEDHLNADRREDAADRLQANFRNGHATLLRHLESLAVKVSGSIADKISEIFQTTAASYRRIRPLRSFPRKSRKPHPKWI